MRWPSDHDRRPAEGVVGGHRPVGVEPEDLAAEALEVLRQRLVAGLAGADPELAVRPEDHAAAVVVARVGDAGEHGRRAAEAAVLVRHPDDAVVVRGGEVGVDRGHAAARGRDREAEQAALAVGVDARDGAGLRRPAVRGHPHDARGVPLGDQGAAVRQPRHSPRDLEVRAPPCRPPTRRAPRSGRPVARCRERASSSPVARSVAGPRPRRRRRPRPAARAAGRRAGPSDEGVPCGSTVPGSARIGAQAFRSTFYGAFRSTFYGAFRSPFYAVSSSTQSKVRVTAFCQAR